MTERHCGDCTLCCRLLPVRELGKKGNEKCAYQTRCGCKIYQQPGFPPSCGLWSCRWLVNDDTADMLRPDRTGYVIDLVPDLIHAQNTVTGEIQEIVVIQVWVDTGVNPRNDKRLRRYAERQAERGEALLLRYADGTATTIFAPALASDHEWHLIENAEMKSVETESGSLFLDRMKSGGMRVRVTEE